LVVTAAESTVNRCYDFMNSGMIMKLTKYYFGNCQFSLPFHLEADMHIKCRG